MEEKKEKYASVIKKVYKAFSPSTMRVTTKIILLFIALLVSFLIMLLKNYIFNTLWK